MTSLEELLLLIPATITTKTRAGRHIVDGLQESEEEIIYHLLIRKHNRDLYIDSVKHPNDSINDYYELDGDQNGDIWEVCYVEYGYEGIESRLPIRQREYKRILTFQEFNEEHEENDYYSFTTGAVGPSLEEVLERVYNWLKKRKLCRIKILTQVDNFM